jgi:hypothetical protein
MSGQVSDVLHPSVAVPVNSVGRVVHRQAQQEAQGLGPWRVNDRWHDDTLIERSATVKRDFGNVEDVAVDRSPKRQ